MKSNRHISDQDWEAVARLLYDQEGEQPEEQTNECPEGILMPGEQKELNQLVEKIDLYYRLKKFPSGQAWEKVERRIHNNPLRASGIRKLLAIPLFRFAAAVVVGAALLVAGYITFFSSPASPTLVEVSAPAQSVNSVVLPDGTEVNLNSNTHLSYPKKFAAGCREVTIAGEAFFEVKPDKHKPFIIHAGDAQIKVLGTSFNVNAYPEEKKIEVIVETGKVQVTNSTLPTIENHELILAPGDKGTLDCANHALLKTTNLNPNFLAWKTHDLYFKSTSLAEVISDLEKTYKIKIRLADPGLNGLLLTAHFNHYPLDFVLNVIETTFNLEVQYESGQYILKAKS
jgi:ferric-dicitrate binding protein FerR (iron transport regulator)